MKNVLLYIKYVYYTFIYTYIYIYIKTASNNIITNNNNYNEPLHSL